MFLVENNNISITKGDSGFFFIKLTNGDKSEYEPKEGDRIVFSVKKKKESFCPLIIEKEGVKITLGSAETEKIPSGDYVYDVVVISKAGERYTAIEGDFCVRKAVHKFE